MLNANRLFRTGRKRRPGSSKTIIFAGVTGLLSTLPYAAHADGANTTSLWTSLTDPARTTLLGNLGGVRPWLGSHGVTLSLQETSEGLANATGGIKHGAVYEGLTTMGVQVDTNQLLGWKGGTFNASALQIHGRGLASNYLYDLDTPSGIESERATRLWELWYQQSFFNGKADVKIGQQSVDQEFIVSQGSGAFMNTMMGWPALPSYDLNGGGPAYPLSSPGIRLRMMPTGKITILAGVFDDDPGGGAFGTDAQALDASGTNFSFNGGVLNIAEIDYTTSLGTAGLPGTYKLGGWYDSGVFPDPLTGNSHRGSYSLYGVADQAVWQPVQGGVRSLNLFSRIMGTPQADRNLVDFALNLGLTLKAPLPKRDADTAGLAFGLTQVGDHAAAADVTAGLPKRTSEQYLELTYQAQLTPWWVVQPDVQYVFNPGAGIQNPADSTTMLNDEAVFAIRTTLTF